MTDDTDDTEAPRPQTMEMVIEACIAHGENGDDPDHEAGDLQDSLRIAYGLMTWPERAKLFAGNFGEDLMEEAIESASKLIPQAEIDRLRTLLRDAGRSMCATTLEAFLSHDQIVDNFENWHTDLSKTWTP